MPSICAEGVCPAPTTIVSGFPLLFGAGRPEVDAASVSGYQKLIVLELRDQGTPDGFKISLWRGPSRQFRKKPPRPTLQNGGSVSGFALHFCCRLQFALEIEAGNIAHHGTDEPVVLRRRLQKHILRIRIAGLGGTVSRVIQAEG